MPDTVNLGVGRIVEALGFSVVRLNLYFDHIESKWATLCNVLYVPKLRCNLFSVRAVVSQGNVVTLDKISCKIYNAHRKLCEVGKIVVTFMVWTVTLIKMV